MDAPTPLEPGRNQDAISAIVIDVEKTREPYLSADAKKRFWCNEPCGRLGVKVRTEILVRCLQRGAPNRFSAVRTIASSLFKRMERALPQRGAGPSNKKEKVGLGGRPLWTEETFYAWLVHRDIAPTQEDAEKILLMLADIVSDALSAHGGIPPVIQNAVTDSNRSIPEVVTAVLGMVDLGTATAWKAPDGFRPWIGPSFLLEPDAAAPDTLSKAASDAESYLKETDGPRVVMLSGPPHCGKKTALRFFLRRGNKYLRLTDNTALPVLAVALGDHTPEEFVEHVFQFYNAAHFSSLNLNRRPARISAMAKIERIRSMAAITPACILLADVAPIDEDEIIRSLSRDYVGDLVFSLLHGHPLTRVVITNTRFRHGPGRDATRLCEHTKIIPIELRIPLSSVRHFPSLTIDGSELSSELRVSGLSWRLAEIAIQLAKRRIEAAGEQSRFQRQCAVRLEEDSPTGLAALIWDRLLSADEHTLVGLIASSQDGLRASVLKRMIASLQRLDRAAWPGAIPSELQLCGGVTALEKLVQSRIIDVETCLAPMTVSEQEPLFSLDDSWRRTFLMQWCEKNAAWSRLGHWLIAREAAHQSRRMRLHDVGSGTVVSFGRDVQALHALIASIDTTAIVTSAHSGQADAPNHLESSILPELEVHAAPPDPRLVLRYAYLLLYRRDLEGAQYRLVTSLDDSRTRLGILLPLFAPETPWLRVDERSLSRTFRVYGHLAVSLDPNELLELLTGIAIAALRVQRYRLLSAAARLGEELVADPKGAGLSMTTSMRLLRAEIDAGLLLGGNPEALVSPTSEASEPSHASLHRPHDVQLTDVARRIRNLLDGPFALSAEQAASIDILTARGKLFARLGEGYHAAGYLRAARKAFESAVDLQAQVLKLLPCGSSLAPVLGGRGVRSLLRFLIDVAHRKAWDEQWSVFIFRDELALPVPRRIDPNSPLLAEASRLHEEDARLMSRGHATDAIGLKIDGARLAVVRHDFAGALALVDPAASMKFTGSSVEVSLELVTVRTRITIDAAILCLNRNAEKAVFNSDAEVAALATYLGRNPTDNPMMLAEFLMERARDSWRTLKKLLALQGNRSCPLMTYARYLEVLLRAVESRRNGNNTAEVLKGARFQLDGVLRHMKESGYGAHLFEARRLRDGINAALAHYDAVSPPALTEG